VDATFLSVAKHYGSAAVAILLTGIGADGAKGMAAISDAGGLTIAQNENSCTIFGMPREAIALGAAQKVLNPDDILKTMVEIKNMLNHNLR
jgi:two-component system, chemotaxis family, protein-glutamate methylesterase/glutaminase